MFNRKKSYFEWVLGRRRVSEVSSFMSNVFSTGFIYLKHCFFVLGETKLCFVFTFKKNHLVLY